jgi:hypothetical protein
MQYAGHYISLQGVFAHNPPIDKVQVSPLVVGFHTSLICVNIMNALSRNPYIWLLFVQWRLPNDFVDPFH